MNNLTADSNGARLTVLIVSIEYPPKAGAGTHVFELANGLARMGCDVGVLAPTSGEQVRHTDSPIKEFLVPPSAATCASAAHLSRVQGVLALNRDLIERGREILSQAEMKPDLIHCHDWYTYRAASELRHAFKIPMVGTAHSTSEPIVRWWGQLPDPEVVEQERAFYLNADALITVSRSMGELIRAAHGVPEARMHVIHNGLNTAPFSDPAAKPEAIEKLRRAVALPGESIIIYAGRLTPQKGISALFASASEVVKQRPNVKYLIAGEADSLESAQMMKSLTQKYTPLRDKIKMLGRVSRKQLALLYRLADLAVVPSIYEPFGYAAIEAMAARVPVIATTGGGFLEIIEHGKTGLLVTVHENDDGAHRLDIEELTAAQLDLLSDEAKANRIAIAGQRHALATFSAERMVAETIEVYRRTIERCSAQARSTMHGF